MKRRIVIVILCMFMSIFINIPISVADDGINVTLDGTAISFDVQPSIVDNRILVPLRKIFEAFGSEVVWDQATSGITATKGDTKIELTVSSKIAYINGSEVELDVPAKVINQRVLVPIRFIGESFGANVVWDGKTKTVVINSKVKLTTQDLVKANDQKVVLLETYDYFGDYHQGSAVAIADGVFVTNYHVVKGAKNAWIYDVDDKLTIIDGIIAYDKDLDLAFIKTYERPNISPVKIGSFSDVKKGQTVVAIGSPNGLKNTISEGIVSGVRTEDNVNLIQISVPITHGSSGGALFNEYGELIGITTFGYDQADLNFAVSADHIKPFLGDQLNKDFDQYEAEFEELERTTNSKLDEIKVKMEINHSSISTSKGLLKLGKWDIYINEGLVYVLAYMNQEDYLIYKNNYKEIKNEIALWLRGLIDPLDEYFPDDYIMMGIYSNVVYDKFDDIADDFYLEEIDLETINNELKWLVTHRIIRFEEFDDRYTYETNE